MLRKLLKYDLKSFMRILLPVYAGILALSAILGMMIRFSETNFLNVSLENGVYSAAFAIIVMLFMFAIMGCGLITLIILIQSYYKNLLGEQGYLMFALPVKARTLVASKIISAGIVTFLSIIVGFVSFAIVMLLQVGTVDFQMISSEEWNIIWNAIMVNKKMVGSFILNVILSVILMIVYCCRVVSHIYASISIGHLWNEHRIVGAILSYIVISIIEGIIVSNLRDISILNIFAAKVNDVPVNVQLCFMIVGYVIFSMVFWFISWKILDKKLNLA